MEDKKEQNNNHDKNITIAGCGPYKVTLLIGYTGNNFCTLCYLTFQTNAFDELLSLNMAIVDKPVAKLMSA